MYFGCTHKCLVLPYLTIAQVLVLLMALARTGLRFRIYLASNIPTLAHNIPSLHSLRPRLRPSPPQPH